MRSRVIEGEAMTAAAVTAGIRGSVVAEERRYADARVLEWVRGCRQRLVV